jgi:hypothetical protein
VPEVLAGDTDDGQDDGMALDPSSPVRRSLEAAVAQFLATGSTIGPTMWERPATDRWNVRQLFAHVVRGMAVLSDYLDADVEATGPMLADAADYFRTALSIDGVHDGIAARAADAADGRRTI